MIIKKLFTALFVAFALLYLPAPLLSAQVNPLDQACEGNSGATLCRDNADSQTHENNSIYGRDGILTKAASIISILVGIAAVIALIIAGLRYVLASGDPANVSKARNTITYALVGIVVAASAQGIIIFVLNKIP